MASWELICLQSVVKAQKVAASVPPFLFDEKTKKEMRKDFGVIVHGFLFHESSMWLIKALLVNDDQRSVLVFQMPILDKIQNLETVGQVFDIVRPPGAMNNSNGKLIVVMTRRDDEV